MISRILPADVSLVPRFDGEYGCLDLDPCLLDPGGMLEFDTADALTIMRAFAEGTSYRSKRLAIEDCDHHLFRVCVWSPENSLFQWKLTHKQAQRAAEALMAAVTNRSAT